jgi:hypothetical protein
MYNKVKINYDTNSINIDLDYEVKQKLTKDDQQNNYQTSLFYEKLNNINNKYLYEAITEATISAIKAEVDLLCKFYLLNKLEYYG